MKLKMIITFVILFCYLGSFSAISAQDDTQQAMDILINAEKTFPRFLINEKFDEILPPYATRLGQLPDVAINWQEGGKRYNAYYSQSGETGGISSYYADTYFGTLDEFHLHTDVILNHEFPEGKGYCFVQYTSLAVSGEESRKSCSINVGSDVGCYTTITGTRAASTIADISADYQLGKTYSVDIIRLNGIGYFYIDAKYYGKIQDGFETKATWMIGAGVSEGGEQALCSFENLWLRRK